MDTHGPEGIPRPLLGITLGDVNGIGPEILAKSLSRYQAWDVHHPLVLGDLGVIEAARRFAAGLPACYAIKAPAEIRFGVDAVPVWDAGFSAPALTPGRLNPDAGRCAAGWIEAGARMALRGDLAALVTCPVNKDCLMRGGCPYPGHTPMLAALSGARDYHMSLFSDRMRVVHITAHLSIRDAAAAVTRDRVLSALRAGCSVLRRLGISAPRIAVAGLNPHAGEAGMFGREEIEAIIPAMEAARAEDIPCSGPYAPDTVFQRMYAGEFDIVIAMYHDQGHIPFKLAVMDDGVHATLGLPFVRTSPDHGTAYDIAWQGVAREHSLCAAMDLAAHWSSGPGG